VRRLRLHYFIGMALTILVAGIGKDERARVEGAVKAALGWRGLTETWSVSLVKVGSQWSVTLSGPGEAFRNLSFGATEQELCEKITTAIGGVDAPPAGAPEFEPAAPSPYAGSPYTPPAYAPASPPAAPYEPAPPPYTPPAPAPYAPVPYAPAPATPAPRTPAPSAPVPAPLPTRAPARAPQPPAPPPKQPASRGDHWTCLDCGGTFKVLY
jgi:hypothetical protein